MAKPWGILVDQTQVEIFDRYTSGYSIEKIAMLLGLTTEVVLGVVRSVPFQADLKLLEDDMEYHRIYSPAARISRLQHKAIDVLVDEMDKPNGKFRLASAQDVLDRGRDVPRSTKTIQQGDVIPAEALSFVAQVLKEVGGIAIEAMKASREPEPITINAQPALEP